MIRQMTLRDIARVAQLEEQLFSSPWSEKAFEDELENNPYSHYVVWDEHGVCGYLGLWVVDTTIQITTLGVDPALQRHGIAKRMLSYLMDYARTHGVSLITLEVRLSNAPAKALYTAFGFKTVAIRKQYYTLPDEDAELMLREVQP
jgi:[ribosomal protein S18]-alanine N-acetyltransferase